MADTVWQDYALAIGQWIMAISLIPMLFAKEKPPLWTSVPTSVILFVFGFTYFTLSLWWATVSGISAGILWLILVVQKYRGKNNTDPH